MVTDEQGTWPVTKPARQRLSHASLLRDLSATTTHPSRRLDAIVVPATRPSLAQRIITFSADISVPLVLLCSKQAELSLVARRVQETHGARALVIEMQDDYRLRAPQQATASRQFRDLSGGRSSDLSLKRNVGLLLARLRGWRKILFVDDDIFGLRFQDVLRLTSQLDRHPVAAMRSWSFPDNSVVCHAGRLAGMAQDVFVSGAVLGINAQHPDLSFFPDIYNEDWFFFARHASGRALPKVGEVRQDEYQPFADPTRATREEFGDLLAEGLYSLFESTPGWADQMAAARTPRYWGSFRADRQSFIDEVRTRLEDGVAAGNVGSESAYPALQSLAYAEKQLAAITDARCAEFIDSWQEDEMSWRRSLTQRRAPLSERDALDQLGFGRDAWFSCGYGAPAIKLTVPVAV